MELVRDFKKLTKDDVGLAGGKGASLGEMTQAGIPVPPGFVILSNAFERFIEETDLNVEIDSILDSVNHKEIHTVENASEKIQALILEAEMPKDIAKEIKKFFKNLDSTYVAVRSSATAEDSASAAWAGQLDSFLNTTEKNLLEKVKRCWASLFTPRAIFYRFEKNLHRHKISVAVVVQKMVESEISGIAFSVHPVTQDRNQLIIEAGFGLGEAIVSGQITPDSYVAEKTPRRIIDKNVSVQTRGLFRAEKGGNEWKDIPQAEGEKQTLTDKQILELSEIILGIENHYGFPCDIEWAFEAGKFYIVQSRPITTLVRVEPIAKEKKWNVIASDFNSFFVRNQIWVKGINQSGKIVPSLKPFNKTLGIRGREGKIDYIANLGDWSQMHKVFTNELNKDISLLSKIIKDTNQFGDHAIATVKKLCAKPAREKTNNQLIKELKQLVALQEMLYAYGVLLPLLDLGDFTYVEGKLRGSLSKILSEKEAQKAFLVLTQPREDSFAVEEQKALLRIAIIAKNSHSISQIFKQENSKKILDDLRQKKKVFFAKILKHAKSYAWVYYAFSGPATKVTDYIDSIKELVLLDPQRKLIEIQKEKESIEKEKVRIKKLTKDQFSKKLFDIAGTFVWAKPRRKDYQSALYYYLIEYYLSEIAKRISLAREQVISLPFDDIANALLKKEKISIEKAQQILKEHIILPSGDGITFFYGEELPKLNSTIINLAHEVDSLSGIKGMTAYPGKAKGKVVVINIPQEMDKIGEGDILVSVATTPSIVPAMQKAAAFVTDEGGLTCHAAIVAREMKKSCIVGTKIATKVLKDGDLVEVDADNGVVRILKNELIATPSKADANSKKEDTWILVENIPDSDIFFFQIPMRCFTANTSYPFMRRIKKAMVVYNGFHMDFYFLENDARAWSEEILENLIEKPAFGKDVHRQIIRWSQNLKFFAKELSQMSLARYSNDRLYQLYLKHYQIHTKLYTYGWYPVQVDILFNNFTNTLKDYLYKACNNKQEAERAFVILTTPQQKTIVAKEREEFLIIYQKFLKELTVLAQKKNAPLPPALKKALRHHKATWGHLGYIYAGNAKPFDEAYYVKEMIDLVRSDISPAALLKKEKQQLLEAKKQQDLLYKKLKTPAQYKRLFQTAIDFSLSKLVRRDAQLFALYTLHSTLLNEIARRLKTTRHQVQFMLREEVEQALTKRKLDKKVLSQRLKHCVYLVEDGKEQVYVGKETEVFTKEVEEKIKFNESQFTGQTAQPGYAKGKVKIIVRAKDMHKMEQGDILVSIATDPDIVSAMKKAGAIVTDQGGITSHAAIVARELGTPCIIGTKIATKVLKDGDLVEVDADNGVVRILESKESARQGNSSAKENDYEFSWGERHSVISTESWLRGYVSLKNVIGNDNRNAFMYVQNGQVHTYNSKEDLPVAIESGRVVLDRGFLQKHLRTTASVRKNFAKFYATFKGTDLKRLSNAQLSSLFGTYQDLFDKTWAYFKVSQPEYLELAKGRLESLIKEEGSKKAEEDFITLTTPTDLDLIKEEELMALRRSLGKMSDSVLRKHAEQYPWLFFNTYDRNIIHAFLGKKFADIAQMTVLERKKRMQTIQRETEMHKKEHNALLKKLGGNKDITYLSAVFGSLAVDRLKLKALWGGAEYLFLSLFEEIAKRAGISVEDLLMGYRIDDILSLLKTKKRLSNETIRLRKELYAVALECGTMKFYEKNEAKERFERIIGSQKEADGHTYTIKGVVANKGKAKGKVKVIVVEDLKRLIADMDRFEEGDVMVTTMTQPTMVSLARKASAIVTNEGGITSHAAILAREYNIPCIVGTKIATQVLKDGDLVEVDADSGVVRILESTRTNEAYTLEKSLARVKSNTQWYNKSYSGYLFGIAQQGMAISQSRSAGLHAMPYGVLFQNHTRSDHWDWFWDSNLLTAKREEILAAAKSDKDFAGNFYQTWKKAWDVYIKTWRTTAQIDFTKLSSENIREVLMPLHKNMIGHAKYAYIVDAFLSDAKKDWLEEVIKAELGDRATPEIIAVLTAPAYESFVNTFEIEKLKVAQAILRREPQKNILLKCKKLAKEFFWIRNNYLAYSRMGASDIYQEALREAKKERSKITKKLADEESRVANNKKTKQELFKKLKVSEDFLRVIEISEIFTHIQDKRKESVLRTNTVFYQGLDIFAKKSNTAKNLIFYLTPDEFLSQSHFEKIDWGEVKGRKEEGVMFIFCNDSAHAFPRSQYRKEIPVENFFPSVVGIGEIRGSTAYKGLVRGIVRVVRNISEIEKFQEGEVLVANQTTPEYVPAMKRAIAFVTDQGGITCHAAIVAREMQKPCIIGTKIATQVLKDGDLVEVDADSGVVRVLESRPITTLKSEDNSKDKKRLSKKDLLKWGPIPGKLLYMGDFLNAVFLRTQGALVVWPDTYLLFKNGRMLWINSMSEVTAVGRAEFERILSTGSDILLKKYVTAVRDSHLLYGHMKELRHKNDSELLQLYNQFKKLINELWVSTVPFEIGNYGSPLLLEEELKRHLKQKEVLSISEIIEALTAPEKPTFFQEEEIALLRTMDLRQHQKKYFWLANSYNGVTVLGEDYFAVRKKDLPKDFAKTVQERIIEIKKKKQKYIKKFSIPKRITDIAELMVQGIELQDDRKKELFIQIHYKYQLVLEVARRKKLKAEVLENFSLDEIMQLLTSGNLKIVSERKSNYGFFCTGDRIEALPEKEVLSFWEEFEENVDFSGSEIRGMVVSKGSGNVKGKVRIVFDPAKYDGEDNIVLVTSMTSPDFITVMKKSIAIITDTGGITSHAAIVSRELGVPCIVNTKIATKVLKDGDLVEVDANNGVVKVIK